MRSTIATTCIVVAIALLAQTRQYAVAQDPKKDAKDPQKDDPKTKLILEQKKNAEEYWKDLEGEKALVVETAHFLVLGKPGKDQAKELAKTGGDLEQQYEKAIAVLQMEKNPAPWSGKLTVFILPDADKYPRMIRLLERRKTADDETGSFDGLGDFPYVVCRAGQMPGDLGAAGNAGVQMAALLMTFKFKTPLPDWLNEGFGRATVLHAGPPAALAADRKKTSQLLTKTNRTVDDIFNNNLNPNEQWYLRGSFIDYLAYSGKTAKFLPFLEGFRLDANGNPGNVQIGLKNANLTSADLSGFWQKHAKSFK
jgi:hypothetical protein